MKKVFQIFSFIQLLLVSVSLHSQQSVYYDAKFIYDNCFSKDDGVFTNRNSLFDLLSKKYFPPGTSLSEAELKKNPFFADLVPVSIAQATGASNFLDKAIASAGGLDVTKYVNAIADILIDRAKQELTVAFFNRFKQLAIDNPEFGILFPKTTENLKNLLTYSYPQMLPALRDGFFADLKQITYHLDDVLDLPRYQILLKKIPEVRMAIRSVRLVHELETGASNAADIIKEFSEFKEWDQDSDNKKMKSAGSCLKIAAFISESIRNDTSKSHTTDIWVPAKEVKNLFYNSTLFNIYMGLLYQKSIKDVITYIDFAGNPTPFSELLKAQKDDIFLFQNKLKEFLDLAGNVNTAFKEFKKKENNDEKITDDDIYNYINTSIDVIDFCFSIVKIFHKQPIADDYLAVAKKSNNLYKSIYTKEYTQAMSDGLDIFSILNNIIDPQLTNPADTEVKNSLKQLPNFIEKVKPYALFMANMIEAKNEDEVKAALENVILPVGSSSIKKNTAGNISVQAYLGAFLSTKARNNALEGTWTDKFGVTAPIGISWTPKAFSWGRTGSLSPFVSLFDLGAIVDYRLRKEQDATNPANTVIEKDYKVQLGQIFSPGVYLVYGFFGNLPLSLGFGSQYGPGLSKIEVTPTAGTATVIVNPSWRWNFFLAVDLPLFNLKNKPIKQ